MKDKTENTESNGSPILGTFHHQNMAKKAAKKKPSEGRGKSKKNGLQIDLAPIPAGPPKLSRFCVERGLIDHGLFSSRLPPCFTAQGLWNRIRRDFGAMVIESDRETLKEFIAKSTHDFIRYEAMRDTNVPRHIGVPHPESNAILSMAIGKNWDLVKDHCDEPSQKINRIHVRYIDGDRIFEMNYKGSERWENEEDEIKWQAGAKWKVKADISTCFPSIYTHSLPWALHGKEESKSKQQPEQLVGNLLDACSRANRDAQTNGLLIGPHASNILSEIILTKIDQELLNKGYSKLFRHIDDYTFYAESRDEAERFIRDLGLALRGFELSLNEKKTEFIELPGLSQDSWVSALQRFEFPQGEDEIYFSRVRNFLDLAIEQARAAGKSTPLNYALRMVPTNLNDRARRLFVREAINLGIRYPYLAPVLIRNIFPCFPYQQVGVDRLQFATQLWKVGIEKLHPDAVAHALYISLTEKKPLKDVYDSEILRTLELKDCISNVLLLEYAKQNERPKVKRKITSFAQGLKSASKREQDQYWLLLYQVLSEKDLAGIQQKFLAKLKMGNFRFLRLEL